MIRVLSIFLVVAVSLFAEDKKPNKPQLTRISPRAVERGQTVKVELHGKHLEGIKTVHCSEGKITLKLQPKNRISIAPDKSLPRGVHEIWVVNEAGESNRIKLYIGDLPQVQEQQQKGLLPDKLSQMPASYWGILQKVGDADAIRFKAKRGEEIVFDLQGKSLGSRATELVLTLTDSNGRVLSTNRDNGEPLLSFTIPAQGDYIARIVDLQRRGSAEHFYRLTLGALPYVRGIYPDTLRRGDKTRVELIGHNLPLDHVAVDSAKAGDLPLGLDSKRLRFRNAFKVRVLEENDTFESEPNDRPSEASTHPLPAHVNGRIYGKGVTDVDHFKFRARRGQTYVMETEAARRGSPLDTRIEIFTPAGQPVPRVKMQAVRDSAINFRPISSTQTSARLDNWEEMKLNEFIYLEGEVCRLFRAPQGPDSGFEMYKGKNGWRRNYFGTSSATHAIGSPCYIVRALRPNESPAPNGLPIFPINYSNDDDGLRQFGSDSRLMFTAPENGVFVVRLSESRGRSGPLFAYRLTIREARPDFKVTLEGANPSVAPGSGKGFNLKLERLDGFEGKVRVDLPSLPRGFHITTPILIEAGQASASGTIYAADDAPIDNPFKIEGKITATATVQGKEIIKTINPIGTVKAKG